MSEDPNRLSTRTTPTWELELLISGALVFSLLKLPSVLDAAVLQLLPRLSSGLVSALMLVSVYLRAAVVALAVAFVVHLMLRAYWVALVGVNSVYPDGPRWDRAKSGVHTRALQERNWVLLSARIERFDNAASLVYAAGVALGVLLLSLSIVVAVMLALSLVLGHYAVLALSMQTWLNVLFCVTLGPALVAASVDYFFGARISPSGMLGRTIVAILTANERFPGFSQFSAIVQTIGLNLPRRAPFSLVFLLLMTAAFFLSEISSTRSMRDARFRIFKPQQNSSLLSVPRHYRDQRRSAQKLFAVPTLASRELGDAALELFVPLLTDRHPAALRESCPEIAQFEQVKVATLASDRAWLDCAGRVLAISLDGVALDASGLLFTTDAQSGLEGLLLRVPNGAFSAGMHVISVKNFAPEHAKKVVPPFQIVVFR